MQQEWRDYIGIRAGSDIDARQHLKSYAEQSTPAAYRIFYGPDKRQITIIAIAPHPYEHRVCLSITSSLILNFLAADENAC